MNCSIRGFPVLHYLLESVQTHVHWVDDAIQPFQRLSPPSSPALTRSQHQGLFQWVCSFSGGQSRVNNNRSNLESIFKSRDIALPTKVHLVKAMVFPVVMYGCESWTVKKAEHWRIDVFELWCWRRLLRVPWTARRSNQSILKEMSPKISLEGMLLKLKLQYFGHLMQRVDSLEKTDAGREWGQEKKGTTEDEMAGWHHRLNGHEFLQTLGNGQGQGNLACCSPWDHKESGTTEWLN